MWMHAFQVISHIALYTVTKHNGAVEDGSDDVTIDLK